VGVLAATTTAGGAAGLTVSVVSASTPMTATTNFSTAHATAGCPSGSTLIGGGDELTRSGSPVPNDGAVTLGLFPSDSSGNSVSSGAASPSFWTATAGYSGMAPGLDTVTAYAMCAAGPITGTVVQVATTATSTLGPVTAVCPGGSTLVGGGGGYTSFPGSNNTKIFDSFPSDAAGDVPADGATNPTAWTLQGNSNNGTAEPTTAVAVCATGVSQSTQVATASQSASPVSGGSTVTATATCPGGTTLLAGGSVLSDDPTGPGTGGQGVHVIGNYPSDGAGNPAVGTAGSWTVIAEDGGQNLTSLGTEALVLCAAAPPDSGGSTGGGTGGGSTTPTTAPSTAGTGTTTTAAPPTADTGTTTTTTATAAGGTGTTTQTTSSSASSDGTAATTSAQTKTASLRSGKSGSLTVGTGSEAVTVRWPKAGVAGTVLTVAQTAPKIPGSHGLPATTAAVQLVLRRGDSLVTHFGAPFDIGFPAAPSNVVPAFTVDGVHWKAIPALGSASLLTGLTDGYYRDSEGALHILTLHATIFGLLRSGTGLKAVPEPLALGYRISASLPLTARKLPVDVEGTHAGVLTVRLTRAGRDVASWRRTLTAAPHALELPLPAALHAAGRYAIVLSLAAGGAHVTHSVLLRVP
jgi:hypothetical protein